MKAGGIIVRQVGSTVRTHSRFASRNLQLELLQYRQFYVKLWHLRKPGFTWRPSIDGHERCTWVSDKFHCHRCTLE